MNIVLGFSAFVLLVLWCSLCIGLYWKSLDFLAWLYKKI
ncbi:hypothetical protein BTI679_63180 (plasmid) [Bacillus wiedmannii]|nr:hypothetical protein BTI679_63180 [Bacillus wiedmannii]